MSEDAWELYETEEDFSLANDLAATHPDGEKSRGAIGTSQGSVSISLLV